jgi:serine/threonine protein kinase
MNTFGPYRILRLVAKGGSAYVYAAAHRTRPEAPIALKVLRLEDDSQSGLSSRRRLLDEARIVQRLEHPNLVRVHEVGEVEGQPFLEMELLDGLTLGELVKSGHVPPGAVVALGIQLCAGLAHAHGARTDSGGPLNLVHRDLKPSNLFLTTQGVAKVIDFGIAHFHDAERTETRTGIFRGTVFYTSPEQAKGLEVDGRADLFSLALVLQELLVGRRVFSQKNEAAALTALLFDPIPSAHSDEQVIPPRLAETLQWALQRKPQERPRDADALAQALRGSLPPEEVWDNTRLSEWVRRRIAETPSQSLSTRTMELESIHPGSPDGKSGRHPARQHVRRAVFVGALVVLVGVAALVMIPRSQESGTSAATSTPPLPSPAEKPAPRSLIVTPPVASEALDAGPRKRPFSHAVASKMSAPGWISVDSRPEWAQVFLNGQEVGPTPVFRHRVLAGKFRVEAKTADGRSQTRTVVLKAGAEEKLVFQWPQR